MKSPVPVPVPLPGSQPPKALSAKGFRAVGLEKKHTVSRVRANGAAQTPRHDTHQTVPPALTGRGSLNRQILILHNSVSGPSHEKIDRFDVRQHDGRRLLTFVRSGSPAPEAVFLSRVLEATVIYDGCIVFDSRGETA